MSINLNSHNLFNVDRSIRCTVYLAHYAGFSGPRLVMLFVLRSDGDGTGVLSPGTASKQLTSPSSATGPPFAPGTAASPEKTRVTNEFVEFLNKLRKAAADDISQQIKALFTQLAALRDVEAKSEAMQTFYRHMYERLNTRAIYRGEHGKVYVRTSLPSAIFETNLEKKNNALFAYLDNFVCR